MSTSPYKHIFRYLACITIGLFSISAESFAVDAISFTLDNDTFIASDDGYTNGVYISWYYYGRDDEQPEPSWLVWPLKWSMPDKASELSVDAYSVGQSMFTPEDIQIANPDPNDTPYAGLLFLSNSYLVSYGSYTDTITTLIGIVGPASGAEAMQKWLHGVIGANQPEGWEYQLDNEFVFKFTRSRMWRNWVSENGHFDFLTGADIGIGTFESSANAGFIVRAGENFSVSHITGGLIPSRTSNFIAVNDGWFAYLMLGGRLIANQIIYNGNTFKDSRSTELDHTQLAFSTGIAYSWDKLSITLAYADLAFTDDKASDASRFGTLTVGWFFR